MSLVSSSKRVTIFLPAYNESRVIGGVLEKLPASLAGIGPVRVVVVDDGSRDDTAVVSRSHGALVARHRINRGVGLATITGIKIAREIGTDILVMMDSDGQHDPDDLAAVIAPIVDGKADVVVGTRLVKSKGMPWIRRVGNKTMNLILRLLAGVRTTDSQSGFRAFNSYALERLRLTTSGYEVHTEMLVAARRAGLRIAEAPIKVIYTAYSKKKGQTITNSLNVIFRLILKTIMGY